MTMPRFSWHRPASLEEAVSMAQRLGPAARFLAGGTDLVIQMNRGRVAVEHVIDVSRLPALAGVATDAGSVTLGALTTHKAIERHPVFGPARPLAALAEAARVVGGHQVRNVGTVGGNVVNASPAADVIVALLALDAELALHGPRGARTTSLAAFLVGPGRTTRAPAELLAAVRVPGLPAASGSAFVKMGRRKAMEISVACVAVRLTLAADGRCTHAAIALGAVGPTALRARRAEGVLVGRAADPAAFAEAGREAAAECAPIGDVRASSDYRRQVVAALVPRALAQAHARARAVAADATHMPPGTAGGGSR